MGPQPEDLRIGVVPTLFGRCQTRVLVPVTIGSLWLLFISPLLPQKGSIGEKYQGSFLVLGLVIGIGLLWEFVYHGLQQFRWEKDWPSLLGLVTGITEGGLVWMVLRLEIPSNVVRPNVPSFVIAFASVWFVLWLWVNGPMRVPFVHWRFRGGRLV
jgi:hypothetical protein